MRLKKQIDFLSNTRVKVSSFFDKTLYNVNSYWYHYKVYRKNLFIVMNKKEFLIL